MRRLTIAVAICALLAASTTALGAAEIFVKIPGVPGTSDCPGHRDFIKAESVILAPNAGDEGGIISISKALDKASPKLARHAGRKTVKNAELHIGSSAALHEKGQEEHYYTIRMNKAQMIDAPEGNISDFHRRLLGGDDENLEQVILRTPNMVWEMPEGTEGKPLSDIRNVFADFGGRRIPLAAFGIGAGDNSRVGIVAERTPPSGLLSGDSISAVGLVLMGDKGSQHLLGTGRADIGMAGTVDPAQVGILSENEPLFGVILSPTKVTFGQ